MHCVFSRCEPSSQLIWTAVIFVEDTCELSIELLPTLRREKPTRLSRATKSEAKLSAGGRRASDKEIPGASIRVAATKLDQLCRSDGPVGDRTSPAWVTSPLGATIATFRRWLRKLLTLTAELRENSMSMRTPSAVAIDLRALQTARLRLEPYIAQTSGTHIRRRRYRTG